MKKLLTASALTVTLAVLLTGCTGSNTAPDKNTKSSDPTVGLSTVTAPPALVETITSISGWTTEAVVDPASIGNQNSTFVNASNNCTISINSQLLSPADPDEVNDAVLSDNSIKAFIFPATLEDETIDRKAISIKNTDGNNIDFIRATYMPTTYFDPMSNTGASNYTVSKKGIIASRVFNQQFVVEKNGSLPSEADRDTTPEATGVPELYTETVRPQVTILYMCDEASFNEDEYNALIETISVTIPFKASKLEL